LIHSKSIRWLFSDSRFAKLIEMHLSWQHLADSIRQRTSVHYLNYSEHLLLLWWYEITRESI
jgi:hypothetical protein